MNENQEIEVKAAVDPRVRRPVEGLKRGGKQPSLRIEDITNDSLFQFRIDKKLAEIIKISNVCTYKEFLVGMLKFHKEN
jgi:hypothetical protein